MDDEARAIARRLARDHWVRLHGTPRVTVLCGGARARAYWEAWLEAAQIDGTVLEARDPIEHAIRHALSLVEREPRRAIALQVETRDLERWRVAAPDRLRTLVDEGRLDVGDGAAHPVRLEARSAAEATLFEALEATPATAARFELNGKLSVRFGPAAAEVDLLSRRDGIAIELDGYHHFSDLDRYRRDRKKDLLLQSQGLLVLRFLAEDVMRDPVACVTAVCQALAVRQGNP